MTGSSTPVDSAMDRFRLTYFEECAELVETAYARLADLGRAVRTVTRSMPCSGPYIP